MKSLLSLSYGVAARLIQICQLLRSKSKLFVDKIKDLMTQWESYPEEVDNGQAVPQDLSILKSMDLNNDVDGLSTAMDLQPLEPHIDTRVEAVVFLSSLFNEKHEYQQAFTSDCDVLWQGFPNDEVLQALWVRAEYIRIWRYIQNSKNDPVIITGQPGIGK